MRRAAAVTFFGFVVICLASLPAMADVWNREWTVTGAARIVVNADESNIRVEAVDSNQVKAVVRTVGWRIADNEVRIIERQSGNLIEIELRRPSKSLELRLRHEITIELTVPRSAEADLHTGDGNITTRGVEAALKCDTGDGRVHTTAFRQRGLFPNQRNLGNVPGFPRERYYWALPAARARAASTASVARTR